jgi:hypothetical protein
VANFFSRLEAQQETVRASRSSVSKRARWESRGARYLRGSGRSVAGDGWIFTDPTLQRRLADMMAIAAPGFAAALNKHFVPVAERAFDAWPVDSGLSKASLSLEYTFQGDDTMSATLRNTAPYAGFINRGEQAQQLIILPGEFAAIEMAEELAASIAKGIG